MSFAYSMEGDYMSVLCLKDRQDQDSQDQDRQDHDCQGPDAQGPDGRQSGSRRSGSYIFIWFSCTSCLPGGSFSKEK